MRRWNVQDTHEDNGNEEEQGPRFRTGLVDSEGQYSKEDKISERIPSCKEALTQYRSRIAYKSYLRL